MDTELEKVTICNFGPFVGEHVLKLSMPGTVTFVEGRNLAEPTLDPNGAGKSFLLNSISWCLYGKTINDLVNTDVRPWGTEGKTSVAVVLTAWEGKEGKRHTVTRTTGSGKNTLSIDGKACQQEDVDRLVGWSHGVFSLAPFLGQGRPLFHDLPNREKLQFLVEVFNLDRWDGYSKSASDEAAAHDRALARLQGEQTANTTRVEELGDQAKRLKESSDAWDATRLKNVDKLGMQIKSAAKHHADVLKNHDRLTVELDGAETELRMLQDELRKLDNVRADAAVQHRSAQSARIAAERDRERAAAELKALKEDKRCPTCQQPITGQKLAGNIKRVEGILKDFSSEAHDKAVAAAKKAEAAAVAKVTAHEAKLSQLNKRCDSIHAEWKLADQTLREATVALGVLKRDLEAAENDANPHRDNYLAAKKKLDRATRDASDIAADVTKTRKAADEARFWIKGFKDIRLNILVEVLDELELVTNSMLDQMGLVGWAVRYDIERETKTGTIARGLNTTVIHPEHKRREDVKWRNWSGGEAQRLRVAGALALSQVALGRAGVDCNILVLDEPTQHLSQRGVDDLCRFLFEYARDEKKSVYLIDHMAIKDTHFDRIVTVTKDKSGSRIDVR